MTRSKQKGPKLRRPLVFPLRFNEREMDKFIARAKDADLPRVEFARCKILDIPFDSVGGKNPKRKNPSGQATA